MGIGPVPAIPKALAAAGLTLDDIDVIELNEAFAVQAVAVIQEAQLPPEKVNVNGGAVALGHPLGCTGTKLTVSLINEMRRQNHRIRHGNDVCRRRHGCRRHFSKSEIEKKEAVFFPLPEGSRGTPKIDETREFERDI